MVTGAVVAEVVVDIFDVMNRVEDEKYRLPGD